VIQKNKGGKGRLQHKIVREHITLKSWYLVKDSKEVKEEVKHVSLGREFQAERTANTKTLKLESI